MVGRINLTPRNVLLERYMRRACVGRCEICPVPEAPDKSHNGLATTGVHPSRFADPLLQDENIEVDDFINQYVDAL
jgi:hypothetical protein